MISNYRLLFAAVFGLSCIGRNVFGLPPFSSTDERIRGQNGTLSLLIAVPLTKNNETVVDPGFFHLAAARLAVDHFNSRNASVVRNMTDLTRNCSFTFGEVRAVDTGTNSHTAMESIVKGLQNTEPPDTIAGPYNEIPTLELSVLATGMQSPMVAPRVWDTNLLEPERHPYFSHVGADFYSEMEFIAAYLKRLGRTNYVAVLYNYATSVSQKVDILRVVLEYEGFDQVQTFAYATKNDKIPQRQKYATNGTIPSATLQGESANIGGILDSLDIRSALEKVDATGYRTIIWMPSRLDQEAEVVGPVAADVGIDQGDHLWVISGGVENFGSNEFNTFLQNDTLASDAPFLKGACYCFPYDGYDTNTDGDFRSYLLYDHDLAFLQRVQELNPVLGYFDKEIQGILASGTNDHPLAQLATERNSYMAGAALMFDSIMSLGLGACNALRKYNSLDSSIGNGTSMTGKQHQKGIHGLDFMGASGRVKFGNGPGLPGSRQGDTVPFTVANIVPATNATGLVIQQAESLDPVSGEWVQFNPYYFAGGSSQPPALLRAEPNQNYISMPVRSAGLTLFAVSLAFVLAASAWVFANRGHSVVLAAQPHFLYTICFACSMVCCCILFGAFDESWGFDEKDLTRSCVAWAWMEANGSLLAYSAVFTKLWRADLCLRYKTNQVELWRTLWPGTIFILVEISIMTAMTVTGAYVWERTEIDEISGDSVGTCVGESQAYAVPIYLLFITPIVLSVIMAWKTLGIDGDYSDSKWVLALVLVQIMVLIVGLPVSALLDGVNPSARYMSQASLLFTFPTTFVCLLILPKYLEVRRLKILGARPPSRLPSQDDVDATAQGPRVDAGMDASSSNINNEHSTPAGDATRSGSGPRVQVVTFD